MTLAWWKNASSMTVKIDHHSSHDSRVLGMTGHALPLILRLLRAHYSAQQPVKARRKDFLVPLERTRNPLRIIVEIVSAYTSVANQPTVALGPQVKDLLS